MTQEKLRIEYDKYKNEFDSLKKEVEKQIIKNENYKGVFYEILPFAFQRAGLKQGKLIENMNRIMSTNDLFTYGFDKNNNIIEVKEGIDIENEFYYQFLFYENGFLKNSFDFNNGKTLQNVRYYSYDENKAINKMISKGRMGGREEEYHYNNNKLLEKIIIKQFDRNGNEGATLYHLFEYTCDGKLKSIIKSALNNDDYKEIIYTEN